MTQIGFIEARDRTNLFSAIAQRLAPHRVSWLVENHAYASSVTGDVTALAYPSRSSGRRSPTASEFELRERVRLSDRAILYFGQTSDHYAYYISQIEDWFDKTKPMVVFGEASSFHAHLAALIAKRRGIPFLNPMNSRYPPGRFAFFEHDRLVSFGGDGEASGDRELGFQIREILAGRMRPDYMSVRPSRSEQLRTRARMGIEWIRGERFNLQNPLSFTIRTLARKVARYQWDTLARQHASDFESSSAKVKILYPLQMQPEMNLDVWGFELRDQEDLIVRLAELARARDGELWVKPNPKSFHEMNSSLVQRVRNLTNVRLIEHGVAMDTVVDAMDLVVTVSGTVAIERILKRKPVAVLSEDYANWLGAARVFLSEADLSSTDSGALDNFFEVPPQGLDIAVMRRLVSTSYKGLVIEPSLVPWVMSEENLDQVALGFRSVLSLIEKSAVDSFDKA